MKVYYFAFLLIPFIGSSQKRITPTGFIIKTNLTSPIDVFSFPTINLSIEKRITHNISLSGEFGYQFYKGIRIIDTSFVNPNGIKANLELRLYHLFRMPKRKNHTLTGPYLGINFFYRSNENNVVLSYNHLNDTSGKTDCLWASKNIWGTNLLIGFQQNIGPKVFVDGYLGLGVMNRTAVDHNREYNINADKLLYSIDFNIREPIDESYLSENNGWRINFNFGIRMGIKLK